MHYFVSDIHLGSGNLAEQKRVEKAFLGFLKEIENDAETLFLVGDIFDFLFEYNEVIPKGFTRVLGRLAELSDKGIKIIMLTGNHDMWIGDCLAHECGILLYTKPQVFSLAGKEIFVAHGDNMNIQGQPILQFMNSVFRSHSLRKIASWLIHPDLFMRFGKWWSGKSRKSHGGVQSPQVLNPLINYAIEYGKNHKIDYYVFGHLHLAADIVGAQRILFMGDWHTRPNYITIDNNGEIELKFYN